MCFKYTLLYCAVTFYVVLSIVVLLILTNNRKLVSEKDGVFHGYESNISSNLTVEIWGKASIALFLWEHILEGNLDVVGNGMAKTGMMVVESMVLNFKYGPLFIQTTVPDGVEYLVLVLNGRSDEKIVQAKQWLHYLPRYKKIKKVAVVLLGNERCDNEWILPYMKSNGGKVNILFLTYDSPLVDDTEFYQWPLGVAEYRGFKNIPTEEVNITSKRPYICNFVGTVYKNSSRTALHRIVESVSANKKCPIIGRKEWTPSETEGSSARYVSTMENSDLTLCPVGYNAECYRIYEAMSVGSVPVVEDVTTQGFCDRTPFRLLKQYNPPFIFIKNWNDLPNILKLEMSLPQRLKRKRRIDLLNWYRGFKLNMKQVLLNTIKKSFTGVS